MRCSSMLGGEVGGAANTNRLGQSGPLRETVTTLLRSDYCAPALLCSTSAYALGLCTTRFHNSLA